MQRKFRKLEEEQVRRKQFHHVPPVCLHHRAAKKEDCRARLGKKWMCVLSPEYGCARGSTGVCPSGQGAKKQTGQPESAEMLEQVKLCSIKWIIYFISSIIFFFTVVYTSKRLLICLENAAW